MDDDPIVCCICGNEVSESQVACECDICGGHICEGCYDDGATCEHGDDDDGDEPTDAPVES